MRWLTVKLAVLSQMEQILIKNLESENSNPNHNNEFDLIGYQALFNTKIQLTANLIKENLKHTLFNLVLILKI